MTSPVSAIEAIEKAIERATQGEWVIHGGMLGHNGDIFSPTAKRVPDCHHIARFFAPKPANPALCELQAIQIMRDAVAISEANAAYVAACSPDRMREVLALARQAEALQRENAEKDERIADLGLGLLSASAQLAKVHEDAFKQAAGYGLVTTDGRDFSCLELNRCETEARRARTLIQGEKK